MTSIAYTISAASCLPMAQADQMLGGFCEARPPFAQCLVPGQQRVSALQIRDGDAGAERGKTRCVILAVTDVGELFASGGRIDVEFACQQLQRTAGLVVGVERDVKVHA